MVHKKGFTLIELLIVLALIGILAAVLVVIIRPAEIFRRGRDTKRIGDLRQLTSAVDAYLNEQATNPSLPWHSRGNCTSTQVFFSTTTATFPAGWPNPTGHTATGNSSTAVNGNGWVPLRFDAVTVLNLTSLPVDPLNGQNIGGAVRVYSFVCAPDLNYEFATYPENTSTAGTATDGGNRPELLEVGSNTGLY